MVKFQDKWEELQKRYAPCILCKEQTNKYGVIYPENKETEKQYLGEATKKGHTRIAFFPICEKHDQNNPKLQKKIKHILITHLVSRKN